MKSTLSDLRKVLVDPKEGSDRHFYGKVTRKNTNAGGVVKSYEVSLGGAEGTMTCRKLAGAEVGDTVMVTLTKTGMAVVTGTVDGDKDAANAQTTANSAQEAADAAQETADAAAEDVAAVEELVGDGDTSGIIVTTQYYLSTSNATPTDGTWVDDMPTYIAGRYYWTKTITTYADGSEVESEPVLDIQSQMTAETDYLLASVNNHFWVDETGGTGAYVSENNLSYSSGYALRMASSGIVQMYNGNPMNTLTSSGLTFYQSNGTTKMAQYTSTGCYFYGSGTLGVEITSTGCYLYGGGTLGAEITSSGAKFYGGSTNTYGRINSEGLTIYRESTQIGSISRASFVYNGSDMNPYGLEVKSIGATFTYNSSTFFKLTQSEAKMFGNISATGTISADGSLTADKVYIDNPSTGSSSTPNVRLTTGSTPYEVAFLSSSSSRKLKHDIKPIELDELDPHRLYDADVIQFIYNKDYLGNEEDCRYDRPVPGFIAEDLYEVYPVAVDVEDGKPQTWNERYIIPPMLALIQEQKLKIDELAGRVRELERRN